MEFEHSSVFGASPQAVFAFHERADAFESLMPPWIAVRNVRPAKSLEVGAVARLEQRVGPIWIEIVAEHVDYARNERFVDVMTKGPFRAWRHEHRFEPHEQGCRLVDSIVYEPPLGILGRLAAPLAIKPQLQRMFEYRHKVTREAVESGAGLQDS